MTKLIFTEDDLRYFTGEPLSGFLILEGNKKFLYTSDFDLGKKAKENGDRFFLRMLEELLRHRHHILSYGFRINGSFLDDDFKFEPIIDKPTKK